MGLDTEVKQLLDELRGNFTSMKAAYDQLKDELKNLGKSEQSTKDTVDQLMTRDQKIQDDIKELTLQLERSSGGGRGQVKTPGDLFLESDQFKGMVKAGGRHSGQVRIPNLLGKDITNATAGDALPNPTRLEMFADPKQPLRVRDLLPVSPTQNTAIEFVKYTFTNAAAPIWSPSPSPGVTEGIDKPKSNMTFTIASETVKTIAHWIAASKQILADIGALRSVINTELLYGLKLVEESQILNGDGTAANLNGIITQAEDYDTGLNVTGDTNLDKLRHAILQARLSFYPVDAMVVDPTSWHNIELTKDAEERYIIGDPRGMIGPTLWGKRVVESDAMSEGTFLVGAFALGARLYDREEANVETSTEHDKFFTQNMVAIRAEERIALVVTRPQAFVAGSF